MRRVVTAVLVGAIGLAGAPSPQAGPGPDAVCRRGSAQAAATALLHPGARVTEVVEVAGATTASVDVPLVAPATRDRLVRTPEGWCTLEGVGAVLPVGDATAVATAFARLAPRAFHGEVHVLRAEEVDATGAGTLVRLRTVSDANGVLADWEVRVDRDGVVEATATTVDIGVGVGFEVAIEGITSLPGHRLTWRRAADGRIVAETTVAGLLAEAAAAEPLGPGDPTVYEASDGFVIELRSYNSPMPLVELVPTGVDLLDRHRNYLTYAAENYEAFLEWGLEDRWPDVGVLSVDGATALACLACATIGDTFLVHMNSLFPELAQLLFDDLEYEDNEEFTHGVIGHEILHAFQGGYGDGQAGILGRGFIEGIARASEALHHTAHGTHQPRSIMFHDSANGCNGFERAASWEGAMAKGPFRDHTYDTCHYWLTWLHRNEGQRGVARLLEALPETLASIGALDLDRPEDANLFLQVQAGADPLRDQAAWAVAGATGVGWTLHAGLGGELLDWFEWMQGPTWTVLGVGDGVGEVLDPGGVLAARLAEGGVLRTQGEAFVVRVVDDRLVVDRHRSGDRVAVAAGEQVWAVVTAGLDDLEGVAVSLRLG